MSHAHHGSDEFVSPDVNATFVEILLPPRLLVVKRIRGGRCRYDPQVKQELVKRCLQPGVSVAAMAMSHGVNANLVRKWITQWQSRCKRPANPS